PPAKRRTLSGSFASPPFMRMYRWRSSVAPMCISCQPRCARPGPGRQASMAAASGSLARASSVARVLLRLNSSRSIRSVYVTGNLKRGGSGSHLARTKKEGEDARQDEADKAADAAGLRGILAGPAHAPATHRLQVAVAHDHGEPAEDPAQRR